MKRIINDANLEAKQNLINAKNKVDSENISLQEFILEQKNLTNKEIKKQVNSLKEKYLVNQNIQQKKILLKVKQDIIKSLKQMAVDRLLNMTKKDTLAFISKVLKKNAEENQVVYVLFNQIKLEEIKSLSIVKKLNLKIKKGSEQGFIFSSSNYDKNLSINYLVDESFEKNQHQIFSLLFD